MLISQTIEKMCFEKIRKVKQKCRSAVSLYLKGTHRDMTLKRDFNQAFTGRKVFVSYENVFMFQ